MATAMKAPAAKASDPKARSLELVSERGYTCGGTARTVATVLDDSGRRLISLTVRVVSVSQADVWHVLTYVTARDDAVCDCVAAQHGKGCFHRGCAIGLGRYVARRARLGWPED